MKAVLIEILEAIKNSGVQPWAIFLVLFIILATFLACVTSLLCG